ncbi:unnamed protein product [Ambrosiozyma monospora]|uniref:Unnamed protein product n=1 Tax=Ambrosiozyma monospora TaxID=43982 RepID=A0ACB5T221_AMBMO|nr:unnamed protein product [Ambrosiozyma monospora]
MDNKSTFSFNGSTSSLTGKQPTANLFGNSGGASSLFGGDSKTGSTSSLPFQFGGNKSENNSQPPLFGANTANNKPLFGASFSNNNKPLFGASSSNSNKPLFGSNPTNDNKPLFGTNPPNNSQPSLFDTKPSTNNNPQPFSFGTEPAKPSAFSFDGSKNKSTPFGPFGDNAGKPLFGGEKQPTPKAFAFGDDSANKSSNTFNFLTTGAKIDNSTKQPTKPKFGSSLNTEKPATQFSGVKPSEQLSNAQFGFSKQPVFQPTQALKPAIPAFVTKPPEVKAKPTAEEALKTEIEPIAIPAKYNGYLETNDQSKNNEVDAMDEDEDDFEIDPKTQLPITKLPYKEGPISKDDLNWLKNGRSLKFQLTQNSDSGVLFLSSAEQSVDKTENEKKDGEKQLQKVGVTENETKLFPFEITSNTGTSEEYIEFLNSIYEAFEPLLSKQAYRYFHQDDQDEEMQIGLLSAIKEEREEKKQLLLSLMDYFVNKLEQLISSKLENLDDNQAFDDTILFNYEESLNILLLLQALNYSTEEERLARFIRWVNRVNIQPDESLLAEAMGTSEHPYENFLFWSTYMKKLILRGFFDQATSSLDQSNYNLLKDGDPILFHLIDDFKLLLQNYNISGFSKNNRDFLLWKQTMVKLRDAVVISECKNKAIATELYELICIASGYSSKIHEHSSSWYECFLAEYLYGLPSPELIDEYIKRALAHYNNPIPETTWESACLDLFQGKYLTMITTLEYLDPSISAFIAILIEASGLLDK